MTTNRFALIAALILSTATGCATNLPVTVKPGTPHRIADAAPASKTAAAAKAVGLKPAAVKAAAKQLAPTVVVFKGTAPAEVQAEEPVAQASEAEMDETLDAFDAYTDEAGGYQLQGLFDRPVVAAAKAKAKAKLVAFGLLRREVARKVLVRHAVRKKLVLARFAHHQAVREAFRKAPWVDNGDGTKTKTVDFKVSASANGKTFERTIKGAITIDAATKALLHATGEFKQQMPNGASLTATSEKKLQEDGSYLATRESLLTMKDGTTRTGAATRTIDAEGKVTGTGTITWKNTKGEVIGSKTWTFTGNEALDEGEADDAGAGGEVVSGDEAEEPAADPVATGAEG